MCIIRTILIFLLNCVALSAQTSAQIAAVNQQKEHLKFITATPESIQKMFLKSGMEGIHPRQFATQQDICRIKELIKKGDPLLTEAWKRLKKQADDNIMMPLSNGDLDDAKLRVKGTHENAVLLPPIIIAYWITGEDKYAKRAFEVFENMATWSDWGTLTERPYTDRHFLDTGISAFDAAIVYDGLYNWMTSEQRDFVYQTAMKFIVKPALAQYRKEAKRTWEWNIATNNWNGICNGNLVTLALMFFERDPQTMSWLASTAVNDMNLFIRQFEPDGQSEEGLMYWGYALMYTLPAFDAMQRCLGTTFGLSETPGMRKTGYFPIFCTGPVTSINIGDDPIKDNKAKSFFWLAKHFKDASLAKMQYDLVVENGSDMPWYDFFYYVPDLVAKGQNLNVPLDNYVYGLELYSMRESWIDPSSMYVGVHGGCNSASHGHLDAGSFYIQAGGEVWAYGDLGRDDYTFPGYFSKNTFPSYTDSILPQIEVGRWHFYRLRAEGKNCLVFNPSVRQDQNGNGTDFLKKRLSTKDFGSVTLDLSNVYNRDVKNYTRQVSLDRKKKLISIQDNFKCRVPSTVWWSMHTKAEATISSDGQSVILSQNGKKMKMSINGVKNAHFIVLPATYLPSEQLPMTKNTENLGFHKVCIKLENVEVQSIKVDFIMQK